ncbi:hypothetical protein GWI33_008992 [Rhynchophorus ferrugineus]|uniref:Histone-lysine N-methyltransferase, H3 lysine-79 specific n=1 Tax=Rhynchophorus ferrugineus TaxID=354439 RepID=A0A834IB96_RHYFE|nr:hypothetical protein GWI33_008992 [Rhynchophorus ferrugineus]
MELRLNSPVGNLPAVYYWPLCKKKGYDEAKEIIETIVWGCSDIPDLSVPLKKNILHDVDVTSYESMKALTKRYNKAINNVLLLEKGTQKFCDRLNRVASKELLRHIIQQTYSAAVTDAEELNKYQAFSPDVYGETSFDLITQMLDVIKPGKDDVFVDLGSGVGQVVLQLAGASPCKRCVGIERADVPAKYAKAMESKFKFWMQWYGKRYGYFELIKGDFFHDAFRDKFTEATVIFVNNFAFGPAVDHKLKERFAELKQGTKIVSSKSFCPLNFRISDRNLSDIGTIMIVSEIAPVKSSVSWTGKPVSYYLHVIDRTKLEKYFQAKKNGSLHSLFAEDAETSCDSFETDNSRENGDKYLNLNAPLKKRGRMLKPPNSSTNNGVEINGEGPAKSIIRPGKLVLAHSELETLETTKKDKKRKRPVNGRPRNPELDPEWFSSCTLRTYVMSKLGNGLNPEHTQYLDYKQIAREESLKRLMDTFKFQYIQTISEMSDPLYKIKLKKCIEEEFQRHKALQVQISELNDEIETIVIRMQNYIKRL